MKDKKKQHSRVKIGEYKDIFGFDALRMCAWVIGVCGLRAVIEVSGNTVALFAEAP